MPVIAARRAGIRKKRVSGSTILANDPLTGTGALRTTAVQGSAGLTWADIDPLASAGLVQRSGTGATIASQSGSEEWIGFDVGTNQTYTVSATYSAVGNMNCTLLTRWTSHTSGWSIGLNGATGLVVVFRNGVNQSASTGAALVAGDILAVQVTPTTMTVLVNGVQRWTTTDSTDVANTKVGIYMNWSTGGPLQPRLTNYMVTVP